MPPSTAPIIFDRTLVRARLQRAAAEGDRHFLLERVAEDVFDRLLPVQRRFVSVLDLGTPRSELTGRLADAYPDAWIVRAAPAIESGPRSTNGLTVDEERLPFRAEIFDLVVSALSLQSVNDLPGTLAQIRRCLRPDGLFLAALFGGQTLHELRRVLAEAEAEFAGGASPRVAPFSDVRDLGGLLQRAGFALPVTDVDRVVVRYDTLFGLLRDLRAMGLTSALDARSRQPARRRFFGRAAELYRERFADGDGRVRATFEIIWLSGWAPHESQQKPLRPGSAKMRLATALGVEEGTLSRSKATDSDG